MSRRLAVWDAGAVHVTAERALPILLLLGAAWGCEGSGLGAAEASELVTPHLERHRAFDGWARRAVQADPAFRSVEALEETVFAPVRRDEAVLAAWIERRSPDRRLVFGHLDEPPKGASWVQIRDETLGALEVTSAKVPDPRRGLREGEAELAVLVRRSRAGADGVQVMVTVAHAVRP